MSDAKAGAYATRTGLVSVETELNGTKDRVDLTPDVADKLCAQLRRAVRKVRLREMEDLNDRDEDVLDYLQAYVDNHGFPPCMRDVAHNFGMSVQNARVRLQRLRDLGVLELVKGVSRGIKILI